MASFNKYSDSLRLPETRIGTFTRRPGVHGLRLSSGVGCTAESDNRM